jgi:hypothetical protein
VDWNVRTDVIETGWIVVDWNHVAQDRYRYLAVVNTVTNPAVP